MVFGIIVFLDFNGYFRRNHHERKELSGIIRGDFQRIARACLYGNDVFDVCILGNKLKVNRLPFVRIRDFRFAFGIGIHL